jgi:hypothetical protein
VARLRNSLAALGFALAWTAVPAFGDNFGTLFFSPKERADLETVRRGESTGGGGEGPAFVRPDPVVTGYVKRSDGKSTVFIDKQPHPIGNERLQERLEPRMIRRSAEPVLAAPLSEPKAQVQAPEHRVPN